MKKYLKTLLIIPSFAFGLIVSYFAVIKLFLENVDCGGFACIGLVLALPSLIVVIAVPLSIPIYYLLKRIPPRYLLYLTITLTLVSGTSFLLHYFRWNISTRNWKTYTNNIFNFSVVYPGDWTYIEVSDKYVYFNPPQTNSVNPAITIKVTTDSREASDPLWRSYKEARLVTLDSYNISIEKDEVGISTDLYRATTDNGNVYLTFGYSKYAGKKYEPYFDKIISTVKLNEYISPEEAARIVSSLIEVKYFMSKAKQGKIALESNGENNNQWLIHVYEDSPDLRATFGWYLVDKKTGEVFRQ